MDTLDDLQLPTFPPADPADAEVLDASRAVVALYLRTGTAEASIRELAAHTGLAERTFYRRFPRKEDAVRPYLRAALAGVVSRVRQEAGRPLREALLDAHGGVLDLARTLQIQRSLGVLTSTERLRAVWLQVLADAEGMFAEAIADHLGLDRDDLRARLAGSAVVAAARLAIEPGDRPPSQVFAECLDLLGPTLLEESP